MTRYLETWCLSNTFTKLQGLPIRKGFLIFKFLLKKPEFGMFLSIYRQVAAPIIVFYLFTEILNFGLLAIWWGFFFITWSAATIVFLYTRRELKIEN